MHRTELQYVRKVDYARMRGVTRRRVEQLEQRGLVRTVAGFVDVAASDSAIENEVRPRFRPDAELELSPGPDGQATGHAKGESAIVARRSAAASLIAAQARAAEARARLTELKVEQARGELVERAEVMSLLQVAFTEVRTELLSLPERIASRVRDAESEHAARMVVDRDVRATLQRCADRLRRRFVGAALEGAQAEG